MSERIADMMPVYLVVFESDGRYHLGNYTVWNIIKSIPCDLRDIDAVFQREVTPLYNSGSPRQITTMICHREVDSPIKELADKPAGWLPGDK